MKTFLELLAIGGVELLAYIGLLHVLLCVPAFSRWFARIVRGLRGL